MAKDPAFLFYSKDFYEGTRMMLPEERACYVDLLIYQHQNGIIPNDIKRLQMYCSGCSEETIKNVLNHKFNQMVNGWSNQRLNQEVTSRSENKPKKIASATFAGLISSSKLTKTQKSALKSGFEISDFIYDNGQIIKDLETIKSKVKKWFKIMVNQMVNNKANEDVNVNKDKDKKGGAGKKDKIDLPYDSEKFKTKWDEWKEYKRKEHNFRYKTKMSEEAALSKLVNLARGEPEAIEVIQNAIANGWKGFYPLKQNNQNGKQKPDPRFDDRRSKFLGASQRRGTVKFT